MVAATIVEPQCNVEDVTVKMYGTTPKVVRIKQYYVTRDEEVPHFLSWVESLKLKILGYDTETSGISVYEHHVATIQFGNPICEDPRAYTFCVRSLSPAALAPVLAILGDKSIIKLGQQIRFEGQYALYRLGAKMRNVIDTMITEMVLRAGLFPGGGFGSDGDDEGSKKAYTHCSMEALSHRYLGIQIDKDLGLRTSFYTTPPGNLSRRQILYANGDVIYPFYIFEEQKTRIQERNLRSIMRIEYEFLPILVHAELRGILIDQERWTELWHEACERQRRCEEELDQIFLGNIQPHLFTGDTYAEEHVRPVYMAGKGKPAPLNWGSPKHIVWAIRQYCFKIEWPIKVLTTKTQVFNAKLQHGAEWMAKKGLTLKDVCADASDPEVSKGRQELPDFLLPEDQYCILLEADKNTLKLRRIRGQLPAELIDPLLAYGQEKSLVSTFGADFLKKVRDDGRIHTEFHQAITSTGRLSSSPNLQNIPRTAKYRMCFIPSPGYKFVIADYSQIEPRISAQVSKDNVYLENYRAKADLYKSIGEKLFGREIDKKTPQGAEDRQASKVVVLALAYRAGVNKLRDQLTLQLEKNISWEHAQELHANYLRECSGIREYQDLCNALADPASGQKIWDEFVGDVVTYITSPCGRHRFFPPGANNTYTESANHPIQGCSATITKVAAVLIQRYIDDNNIDAVGINFVHDEIVYEVREDQAPEFAKVVQRLMEEAGQYYLPDVPCIAEFPEGSQGVVPYWTKSLK